MKTRKIIALIMACLLILSGCRKQISTTEPENTPQPSMPPAKVVVATETTESTPTKKPQENEETVSTAATETPSTETTSPPSEQEGQKSAAEPTKPKPANPSPTKEETEPPEPATVPSVPQPTQSESEPTISEATEPESEPTVPETTEPETKPTVPVTTPTEPKPDEPTGCAHDWTCIHHDEVGHWKAGIVCDCGWAVYGDADELVAKWNAHSASYPAEEAFFNHGGYGSADEWIVDEPAYDKWVCRLCGESKS